MKKLITARTTTRLEDPIKDVEGQAIVQKLCEALQPSGTEDVSHAIMIML
jgi:hypothetical protein